MFFSDFMRFLGFKGDRPQAVRKPAGYTKTTGPYGEIVDCDTLQCVHCRYTWEVVAGSGRLRGFCTRCMGYVCGRPDCMSACVPFELRLENREHGLPDLTPRPEQVLVPVRPPSSLIVPRSSLPPAPTIIRPGSD